MKKISSTLALLLPAVAALAIVPQEVVPGKDINPQFTPNPMRVLPAAASSENKNSFFEGFEGRDPDAYGAAANAWLPTGWTQFSRAGNSHAAISNGYWDLTWLTLSNETVGSLPGGCQSYSYEGESFAYIMADVMWGSKEPYPDLGLDYATNHPQDEWLVSPVMTPGDMEWFYFQLRFRPGWSLYNREANNFTAENNLLEVYVTEGAGTTDSNWTRVWSLKDHIAEKYTEEQLRADLTSLDGGNYDPIFVNVKDYVGKNIKVAFRYYGVNGQGMTIDNVALGIPMPKPSYKLPAGFFTQQTLSPIFEEITGTPQILAPFGVEATWANTSKDILTQQWAYDDADATRMTTDAYHLVTPAYEFGHTYQAPQLTGIFENRSATYQTPFTAMQAGGTLSGTGAHGYSGRMGIAAYNYLDPLCTAASASTTIAFYAELDEQWELMMGRMPETLDVLGFGTVYPASPIPYGFDYVDIFAQITSDGATLTDDAALAATVFRLPDNEFEGARVIGYSVLTGADINAMTDLGYGYKNIRFDMPVPVVADGNILVLISPLNIVGDNKIAFPFLKTTDPDIWGTSVAYIYVYESEENGGSYDTFYNLNNYPVSNGHFAGLTMSLGASYSYMEAPGYDGEIVEVDYTGGEYKLDIRSSIPADQWVLTDNGVTPATWATFEAVADNTDAELYHVTLKFPANTTPEGGEMPLYITQSGARVTLNMDRLIDPAGIGEISAEKPVSVVTDGESIIVKGACGTVTVYNTLGTVVAAIEAAGEAVFSKNVIGTGVFIVRAGETSVKVIL